MLVVEKIEGNVVTVEDGYNHFNLNKTEISFSIKEGDVIQLINGEYRPDIATTNERKNRLAALQNSLFSDQ